MAWTVHHCLVVLIVVKKPVTICVSTPFGFFFSANAVLGCGLSCDLLCKVQFSVMQNKLSLLLMLLSSMATLLASSYSFLARKDHLADHSAMYCLAMGILPFILSSNYALMSLDRVSTNQTRNYDVRGISREV